MREGRRWRIVGLVFAALGASLWAAPPPVAASTDQVTTCANSGAGSLPAVVAAANANDTVVFMQDCSGANAITLTSGTGTITIGVNLTIDATVGGHAVTVDGGHAVSVFTVNSGMTVTLNGLTIQHGGGNGNGGGIVNDGGTLTVMNSTLSGSAVNAGTGGGIYSYGGTLTVTNTTLSGNSAGNGGGIDGDGGTLTVTNSTLSGNSALGEFGGGIYNHFTSSLTVTNSTLTGNSATTGGGIDNASTLTVTNTLIAGNTADGGPDVGNGVTSGGHNLVGKTDGSSGWGASDLTGTAANPRNPLLGPFASNGGPTQTFALLSGSPAIGAGDATVCRQTGAGKVNGLDQRGLPRLASTCDIGAYQLQGTHVVVGLSGGGPAGTSGALTVALLDGYGNFLAPYTGAIHFTSTDPLATLPADYPYTGSGTGKDNGVHLFMVTLRTAGTQHVTATDTLESTLTGEATAAITPVVTTVSPDSGGTAGGNHVTLTGIGFGAIPANVNVTIGGAPATVGGVTNTQLVVTAPSHAGVGAVNVVVTANGQSATVANGYTYGVVAALPSGQPVGGGVSNPGTLPQTRPTVLPLGNPDPLPPPRP